ncbi:MAG: pyridoxine 5'-phosphate synthase [Verrucomicrobia bacterium]|nr:MAG: pyridoxine 5'-phosphate synthase [Verrucomicrobiota bacterium]
MTSDQVLLGVNIDHSATLRQARYRGMDRTTGGMVEPDPVLIALLCEKAGADGITVHLREDRRHIQERDVRRLRESITTRLNLEMASTSEMIRLALEIKPDAVCLVPENREEISTEGGLDVVALSSKVGDVVAAMNESGIETSLFIDPDPKQIEKAALLKAPWIELHTGSFANTSGNEREREFERLNQMAALGASLGLTINAGHGINYVNISEIMRIPHLHELNIGHSIISRALLFGIDEAVREMKAKILSATPI